MNETNLDGVYQKDTQRLEPSIFDDGFQRLQEQIRQTKLQNGIVLVTLTDDCYKQFLDQLEPSISQSRHILFFEGVLKGKDTWAVQAFLKEVKTYMEQNVFSSLLPRLLPNCPMRQIQAG